MLIYRNSFHEAGFGTGTVPIKMNLSTVTIPIIKLMLTGMAPVNYSYLIANYKQTTQYRSRNLVFTVHSYPNGHFASDC